MGGLALKHLGVERIPADRYHGISSRIQQAFVRLFNRTCLQIPAYSEKKDFGDCDMIIVGSELPPNWMEGFAAVVGSRGFVRNGDVTSMEIENFQFDFISVPYEMKHFAHAYFSYNDLGNLMGRIAHKMGFKYGHLGFSYVMRHDQSAHQDILVSPSLESVFDFLGYDFGRWQAGFSTLEDIFEFVASSPYFNPDIYLLHNVNAVSRIRDAKRKTYTEFLKWCRSSPSAKAKYTWTTDPFNRVIVKDRFLQRAMDRWPVFRSRMHDSRVEYLNTLAIKAVFNGTLVSEWVGLKGELLGVFMRSVRSNYHFMSVVNNHPTDMEAFVKGLYEQFKIPTRFLSSHSETNTYIWSPGDESTA